MKQQSDFLCIFNNLTKFLKKRLKFKDFLTILQFIVKFYNLLSFDVITIFLYFFREIFCKTFYMISKRWLSGIIWVLILLLLLLIHNP